MCAFSRKPITPEQALTRLETLCAASEHCTHELRMKLANWGIQAADASEIIKSLERRKFLSDSRFAIAYVRDKYRFGKWGRRKITLALMQKRIERDAINNALAEIDEEEYQEILFQIMRTKARAIKEGNSYEGRTRLFRSIASRGYETSLISKYIADNRIWEE